MSVANYRSVVCFVFMYTGKRMLCPLFWAHSNCFKGAVNDKFLLLDYDQSHDLNRLNVKPLTLHFQVVYPSASQICAMQKPAFVAFCPRARHAGRLSGRDGLF